MSLIAQRLLQSKRTAAFDVTFEPVTGASFFKISPTSDTSLNTLVSSLPR